MIRQERERYFCDLCSKELFYPPENRYKFEKKWQSGVHGGWIEQVFDVCEGCELGNPLKGFWHKLRKRGQSK